MNHCKPIKPPFVYQLGALRGEVCQGSNGQHLALAPGEGRFFWAEDGGRKSPVKMGGFEVPDMVNKQTKATGHQHANFHGTTLTSF